MTDNDPDNKIETGSSLKWTKANIILAIVMLSIGLFLGYLVTHFVTQGTEAGGLSETTIIAIVFFLFLALLTGFAMVSTSDAVANAIKMLTSLSAIFGVVIGAIPGFYFANKVNQSEIKQAKQETNMVTEDKQKAVEAANTAGALANELANAISNVNGNSNINGNRTVTIESNKLKTISNKINKIQEVTNQVAKDAKAVANK